MATFEGNPNLLAELARLAELEEARRKVAEKVAETAQDIAPVGGGPDDPHPGRFKDSIHANGTRVESDDPAAPYIVFGTSHSPPHDTFRRAAEMNGLHPVKESTSP